MKRGLQVSLLVVGAIPLALGIMNAVMGAAAFVPTDSVSANLDSQLRFYGVWFTLPFFLALWMVRNIETCGPVLRITFVTMATAGAARIVSMWLVGLPDPPMIAATFIEVSVLVFIPWQAAVARRGRADA